MATNQLRFLESYSTSSTKTLISNTVLPPKARITSITVPGVSSSKITHSYNEITGALTVTLNSVPYSNKTSSSESYPLSSSSISGTTRVCRYYISSTVGDAIQHVQSYESCPVSYRTTSTNYSYDYLATIEYETNAVPTITLNTTDNRTLYENDTFNLSGTYNDADSGNVISVKYSINNGTARALTSAISDTNAKSFTRVLTYKSGKLYDGATIVSGELTEGSQQSLRVWAEDDKGGKSAEQLRIFYVVANRAPVLTIAQLAPTPGLLNTGNVKFNGTVTDPDGNTVKVEYKVGSGSFAEVYSGTGGSFEITVPLALLNAGTNAMSVRATDSYGAVTTRNLNVSKAGSSVPLLVSEKRYRITPPNGSAQGLVLWVQRESGDLTVSAEISMTAAGEAEAFVPMVKNSTAFVNGSIEEDEFAFEGTAAKDHIVLKLRMTRTNAASTAGVKLINGVLS